MMKKIAKRPNSGLHLKYNNFWWVRNFGNQVRFVGPKWGRQMALLLIFAGIAGLSVRAQQTWTELELTGKIYKKLDFSVSPGFRFLELPELSEYLLDAGIEYEWGKYFSTGAGYRIGNQIKSSGKTESYGRFAFDAKAKYKWKKLDSQVRLRFTNSSDFQDDNEDKSNYLRLKYKLDYSIKKIGIKPYLAYELYRDIPEKSFSKARYETGVSYKLNKHNSFGAYYRINSKLNMNENTRILGLTYTLKL